MQIAAFKRPPMRSRTLNAHIKVACMQISSAYRLQSTRHPFRVQIPIAYSHPSTTRHQALHRCFNPDPSRQKEVHSERPIATARSSAPPRCCRSRCARRGRTYSAQPIGSASIESRRQALICSTTPVAIPPATLTCCRVVVGFVLAGCAGVYPVAPP